jgi:26S proteasome regulatory subunit T5
MSGSGLEEGLGVDAFALEVDGLTVPQIQARMRMEKENARHSTNELRRLQDEVADVKARIAENDEKIKVNKQLPYLVSTVVEVRGRARFLRPRA